VLAVVSVATVSAELWRRNQSPLPKLLRDSWLQSPSVLLKLINKVIHWKLMKTKKRNWKRRLILSASFLLVMTGIFVYLVFTRFHFSNQMPWPLARLQGNDQANVEFNGIRPKVIGHRGSGINSTKGDFVIGNTFKAIDNGIIAGVDWIEIDLRLSTDADLMVFHDETVDKKTTGEGKVSDLSTAKLKKFHVHVGQQERIPTLEEVFTKFHLTNEKWILDVKEKGIHNEVLEWLDDKVENGELSHDQVMIFGTYEVLLDYRDQGYSLGYTAIWGNWGNRLRILFHQSEIITRCEFLDCDYLVLPVIFANEQLINDAKSSGRDVWVYGTDNGLDFNVLANRGVSGFIVDKPKEAMDLLRSESIGNFTEADAK
jgi:glycerophosphoryl diester phosphodiesterase